MSGFFSPSPGHSLNSSWLFLTGVMADENQTCNRMGECESEEALGLSVYIGTHRRGDVRIGRRLGSCHVARYSALQDCSCPRVTRAWPNAGYIGWSSCRYYSIWVLEGRGSTPYGRHICRHRDRLARTESTMTLDIYSTITPEAGSCFMSIQPC